MDTVIYNRAYSFTMNDQSNDEHCHIQPSGFVHDESHNGHYEMLWTVLTYDEWTIHKQCLAT